jgi:hypothetical protein
MELKKKIRYSVYILTLLLISVKVCGQVTKIMGKVVEAQTKEPIAFANVYFLGTSIGVTSDFDGNFSIETKTPSDSLVASYVSHKSQSKRIYKNRFQEVVFELLPKNIDLPEVTILAGENPAEILLRRIIENKENNNRREFEAYQYEVYNKIEIDANNLNERFRNRKILKPFSFVFDYIDTSTVNGKTYLPIFISESLSDFYFRKNPKAEKEVIKAAQVSGIENESILQFLGDMLQRYDFYDNYITIFQKNFISPIANIGLNSYKYYLVDSTYIGNQWCYKVMYKPRRKQELTFTGHFWVHDTTFAIKSFDMRIAEDANINFIDDLVLSQEYSLLEGKYWMVTKDQGIGDFNIVDDSKITLGFFGKKTTSYRYFVFDQLKDKKFYSLPTNVIVDDKAYNKDEKYWNQNRHDTLSKDELTIYHMVDTLKNLPAFKTWVEIFETVITGYYRMEKFEIGPYASLVSFNAIEGARFRIGGRTTAKFNDQFRLDGYIAYGTLDTKFKYGLGLLYLPNKNPRRSIGGKYKYDIEQLGSSPNAFREDFFFSALFRRNPANKLSMTSEYTFYYEHEWFNGFSNQINLIHKEVIPVGESKIELYDVNGDVVEENNVTISEIRLDSRLAYNEKFIIGDFERTSIGTRYPIINVQYGYGIPGLLGGEYEYHRLKVSIRQWFNIFNLGWSRYIVETGKIWGKLPYPFLELHPGNETFFFDEFAFNLMNYGEFVSDEFVSFYYTHHFDGLFLNHIPLFRKLKWREVGYVRGAIGTLSSENKNFNKLPDNTSTLEKPYYEAGIGIENILKVIRIDGIWRLSHQDNENINNFAFFFSLYFTF